MLIQCVVNGRERSAEVEPWTSLLGLLRNELGLIGAKDACEQGECGACSVWLDGEVVCTCLVPAAQVDGCHVRTVESLAANGALHPVQDAFLEAGAVQCGFCTPGLVVVATDLLERGDEPDEAVVREALAGNLCRCTGYGKVVDAVCLASEER
ncbi:MAG TPA: (2Fe-2S)-binding protein [Gaiellaceae bacterium]|nr:(2Fe-2S)-binding protein [Gaiellaceae bacterium]